ncbi:MAG: hypothetical protein LBQ98_06620 [Nitrososphaerota archaeon]|nr:hypothetical protein [Nitrososphaerota archaeon]
MSPLNHKIIIPTTITLTIVLILTLILSFNTTNPQTQNKEFYLGIEYAYGNKVSEVKTLVDKVKNYTNLFILGSVDDTFKFNQTALDEASDYIINAKLHLIVLFTGSDQYTYSIFDWMSNAQQKYGNQFLGVYRYDEPGGNQIDNGPTSLIKSGTNYPEVAQNYTNTLKSIFVDNYLQTTPKIFTADYGLYWFNYKANYTTLFIEYVGNESRTRHIALGRAAAETFEKDWGVIITWKYDQPPYLESGDELYCDLALAYACGAKYAAVFSYPAIGKYGTLTDEHFETLEKFWNTLHTEPNSLGSIQAKIAYVVPADYGFGFRRPDDTIWGLFPADELSEKIYTDVKTLTDRYGAELNIFYDEPKITPLLKNYSTILYWNQTLP